jgi:hypothetical protein
MILSQTLVNLVSIHFFLEIRSDVTLLIDKNEVLKFGKCNAVDSVHQCVLKLYFDVNSTRFT